MRKISLAISKTAQSILFPYLLLTGQHLRSRRDRTRSGTIVNSSGENRNHTWAPIAMIRKIMTETSKCPLNWIMEVDYVNGCWSCEGRGEVKHCIISNNLLSNSVEICFNAVSDFGKIWISHCAKDGKKYWQVMFIGLGRQTQICDISDRTRAGKEF